MTLAVGILLFDGVELLDFAGPYEVFTVASRVRAARRRRRRAAVRRVHGRRWAEEPVRTHAGLRVAPDHAFADAPAVDVLVVPGGVVDGAGRRTRALVDWIARTSAAARLTASVCTGAFLLARRRACSTGHAATTHWEDVDDLRPRYPGVRAVKDCRWVDDGDVVTAAGIAAGIDMALHLVERLEGHDLALETARYMEYDWDEA